MPSPAERLRALYELLIQRAAGRLWDRILLTAIHGSIALARALRKDRIHVRAATLGYWTLVAIVPTLLLAFSLMRPLGLLDSAADRVKDALYSSIFAGSVAEVGEFIDTLVGSVKFETLGVVGFLGVVLTSSKMYFSVEQAYNDMFGVRSRRGWLLRITIFYAIVTLTPLLLSLGFLATSALGGALPSGLLGRAVPVTFTTAAFVLAIKLLPQVRVRWRAALAGGLSSAILFELAKAGFGAYTRLLGAGSMVTRVYGSLGLFPVFLVYLYLLWLVVLFGVELAYVVQNASDLLPNERARLLRPESWGRTPDAFFALQVALVLVSRFLAKKGPTPSSWIARELGAPPQSVRDALRVLERAGLVASTEAGVLPAVPVETSSAAELVRAYREATVPPTDPGPTQEVVERTLRAAEPVLGRSLRHLAAELEPGETEE